MLSLLMAGDFAVGEFVGIVVDRGVEVAVKDIERQFSRVDTDLTEAVEDFGTTGILCIRDRLEVLPPIVGSDAVLVVDTRFVERTYPREIDGVRDEDGFIISPSMNKIQIPLFAFGIGWVFAVLGRSEFAFHYRLASVGRDTQTDGTVIRYVEPIAVVRFVWHKVQENALVHDF